MHLSSLAIRSLLLLPLLALAVFCGVYLTHDYDALARWYHSLAGPFYKEYQWQRVFFTPETKESGNVFCSLALVGIAAISGVIGRQKFRKSRVDFRKMDASVWVIVFVATGLGVWSAISLPPAADEAFSAQYAAGGHPFRALSYYMLPNNHVLFNTLNAFVSNENNALWHGRIVSILAYIGSGLLAYQWLREVISSSRAALFIALLQLTIFPVWGFAGQARGYELYLLAHGWVLLLVTRYLQTTDGKSLFWFPLAVVVGYGTVPTFLYFHGALLGWMLYNSVVQKKRYLLFWRAQLLAFMGVFLFYVPTLCFSGLSALTSNKYVTGTGAVPWKELPPLGPYKAYLTGMGPGGTLLGLLVLAFAVCLLLRKETRRWGMLFCALWLAAALVVMYMQRIPFHRNLIGLYAVSVALAGLGCRAVFRKFLSMPASKTSIWLTAGALLFADGGLLFINARQLSESLYFYPVRETAQRIEKDIFSSIPAQSKVAFSEEAFLAEAFWRQRGGAVVAEKNAAFCVQLEGEKTAALNDTLLAQSDDLQLYSHP